jgi:hypothetical protein
MRFFIEKRKRGQFCAASNLCKPICSAYHRRHECPAFYTERRRRVKIKRNSIAVTDRDRDQATR